MSIDEFYGMIEDEVVNNALQMAEDEYAPTSGETIDLMYEVLDNYLNSPNYAEELLDYFNGIYSKQVLQSIYNNASSDVNPENPVDLVYAILEAKYLTNWEKSCVDAVNYVLDM